MIILAISFGLIVPKLLIDSFAAAVAVSRLALGPSLLAPDLF
jgi:hypothetical protein